MPSEQIFMVQHVLPVAFSELEQVCNGCENSPGFLSMKVNFRLSDLCHVSPLLNFHLQRHLQHVQNRAVHGFSVLSALKIVTSSFSPRVLPKREENKIVIVSFLTQVSCISHLTTHPFQPSL